MKPKLGSCLIALLLMTPAAAFAAEGYTVATVNMLAGPDPQYPVVITLGEGTPVSVQGCTEGWEWCDVIAAGERGWVAGPYIEYLYNDQPVMVTDYGAQIGIPVVAFVIGTYWGRYYLNRPFYHDRMRWYSRPIPVRPFPGPRPSARPWPDHRPEGPGGYRPSHPGTGHQPNPGYSKPQPPGGGHGGNQGQRPPPQGGGYGGNQGQRQPPQGGDHGGNQGQRQPPQGGGHGGNQGQRPPPQGGDRGGNQGQRPLPQGGDHGGNQGPRPPPQGGGNRGNEGQRPPSGNNGNRPQPSGNSQGNRPQRSNPKQDNDKGHNGNNGG